MKILNFSILAFVLLGLVNSVNAEVKINGAGASFPKYVYQAWMHKYNQIKGIKFDYQSIGSGGGIAQIKAKTVDFGASDAPLTKEELEEAGLIQFPMIMGGVVPIINIPGIKAGQLKLTAQNLADIFLGKITKWNDPAILALNNDIKLPNLPITVVHRADGSGTTWIFTYYLKEVSKAWANGPGSGKAIEWPVGIGGKGNEGVTNYVTRIKGSIGYVEFAYALKNNIAYPLLGNQSGAFVAPTIESFQSACASANWEKAPGFFMVLVNQPGENTWPITGASFILLYKEQTDIIKAKTMLDYFDWCFKYGGNLATELHYVPIPEKVYQLVEKKWKQEIKVKGKEVWTK